MDATALCCPATCPNVHLTLAMPLASVVVLVADTEPGTPTVPPTTAQRTVIPRAAVDPRRTTTRSAFGRVVATGPVCWSPLLVGASWMERSDGEGATVSS